MDVTKSKYFFLNQAETETRFGLLYNKENKFYMIDTNYKIIKLVQFLFLKYRMFTVINMRKIAGASDTIDNNKCHLLGCSMPVVRNYQVDADVVRQDAKICLSTTPAENFNVELQEKVMFVRQILNLSWSIISAHINKEKSRIEDIHNGLDEFSEYASLVLPGDENIPEFVKIEKDIRLQSIMSIESMFTSVINLLNSYDLYTTPVEELRRKFKFDFERIENAHKSAMIIKKSILGKLI